MPALVLAASMAGARSAEADDDYRELFDRGLKDMLEHRYESGCPALAASYRLSPLPGTLFTLAECESERGRIATAVARFDEYLELFASMAPERKAGQRGRDKVATDRRAALLPDVPRLTLTLAPGAPNGTTVRVDGAEVGAASLGAPKLVDPGEHTVSMEAPGGTPQETRITLQRREAKEVVLSVTAAPAVATLPPVVAPRPIEKERPGPSGMRIGAYVAGGVGIAGLVLGGVSAGVAAVAKGDTSGACVDVDAANAVCTGAGKDAGDRAKTAATWSTVGFAVGLAGLGTGTVLYLLDPQRRAPAVEAPRSSSGGRPWIGVTLLSASSKQGVLALQGGF